MSGLAAFITGFATRASEINRENRQEAQDYFNRQMERASTRGVENLNQRKQLYSGVLSTARTLKHKGNMPSHVLRAVANEGPEALEQANKIYQDSIKSGVELTEDHLQEIYDVSEEVIRDSDQSLEDFLRQATGLYSNNLEATKEIGGDPVSAFVSSVFGTNAMDRSRSRLQTEELVPGYTAQDLLALEGRPASTRPLGDTGLIRDDRAAVTTLATGAGAEILSDQEKLRFAGQFRSRAEDLYEETRTRLLRQTGPNQEEMPSDAEIREMAYQQAAMEYAEMLSVNTISQLPPLLRYLPEEFLESMRDSESAEDTQVTEGEGVHIPEEGEITVTPLPEYTEIPEGFDPPVELNVANQQMFFDRIENGRFYYRNPEGEYYQPMTFEELQQVIDAATPVDIETGEEIVPSVEESVQPGRGRQSDLQQRTVDQEVETNQQTKERIERAFMRISQGEYGDISIRRDEEPPHILVLGGTVFNFTNTLDETTGGWVYETDDGRELIVPINRQFEGEMQQRGESLTRSHGFPTE